MKTKLILGMGLLLTTSLYAAGSRQNPTGFADKLAEAKKTDATAIVGKDGWFFFVPELAYLTAGEFWGDKAATVSHVTNKANADPLAAIVDFKTQLDAKGIDLIFVPVPAKASIYPDKLTDAPAPDPTAPVDTALSGFLKVLKDKGIKTIDLAPIFLQYRKDHPDDNLYSKQDTHWSGTGIKLAADAIATEIKRADWYGGVPKSEFTATPTQIVASGDLVQYLTGDKPGPETFNLTVVKQSKGGAATDIASDRQSPVVLIGDSHNLIYSIGDDMLAKGAGLPENLSQKLGFVPDVVAVKGSGTIARRNLRLRGDDLKGKKVIVWCFTAREFTEGQGWPKIAVFKPVN